MSFETLSGKNTTEFYWRRGFSLFSSGLNEDGRSSTAVTPNHGKACRTDAVAASATTRRNAGPRATVPRTSRATTCWHEGYASTPCEAPSVFLPPATSHSNFLPFDSTSELWKDCWSRFLTFTRAHAVPDDRVFSPTSHRRCVSCFQTLQHKKRHRGKSTILQWIRSWRPWRCNLIQPVSSSGNVSSSGLPCNVDPGSPFKSWLHAYVKQS